MSDICISIIYSESITEINMSLDCIYFGQPLDRRITGALTIFSESRGPTRADTRHFSALSSRHETPYTPRSAFLYAPYCDHICPSESGESCRVRDRSPIAFPRGTPWTKGSDSLRDCLLPSEPQAHLPALVFNLNPPPSTVSQFISNPCLDCLSRLLSLSMRLVRVCRCPTPLP